MSREEKLAIERLAGFLKTLDDKGILHFNKNLFNNRLKVQKYVYIAKNYGIRLPYSYSLYLHGPYSSKLADAYYKIDDFHQSQAIEVNEEFFLLVKNKSEGWLELAATLVMIRKRYDHISDDTLITLVKSAKPKAEKEELRKILEVLRRHNCLS